jgi:uncharacterized protein (DUF983 family)
MSTAQSRPSEYSCTFGQALGRGLMRRCPRCGQPKIFSSFFSLRSSCPRCGFRFEREEGYWTGAMIVNIAACEIWFAILFIGVIVATLPDIAWVPLLGVALFTNGLLPVVFYPWSKTIWMAFDVYYHHDATDDLS